MGSLFIEASIRNFYETVLICRPADPIAFAAHYFEDEKKTDPEYYHAMGSLIYLIDDDKHFRDCTSTIFIHLLEKSRSVGEISASVSTLTADATRNAASTLVDESYVPPIPTSLRDVVDAALSAPQIGFVEFDIYLRSVVKTSALYKHLKDILSAACTLKLIEGSRSSFPDSMELNEFRACLTSFKIKLMVASIPAMGYQPPRQGGDSDSPMHQALVTVLNKIEQRGGVSTVSALNIVKEFLVG